MAFPGAQRKQEVDQNQQQQQQVVNQQIPLQVQQQPMVVQQGQQVMVNQQGQQVMTNQQGQQVIVQQPMVQQQVMINQQGQQVVVQGQQPVIIQQVVVQQQQQPSNPLELLDRMNEVYVVQPIRVKELLVENFLGWNMNNYYEAGYIGQNGAFVPTMFIKEDSDCCLRQICQTARPLTLNVFSDKARQNLLFYLDRPYRMNCFCMSGRKSMCGKDYISVRNANGDFIGAIESTQNCWCTCTMEWGVGVFDAEHKLICEMVHGCFVCACCDDVNFNILVDNEETGKAVSKTWTGVAREAFTDNDNFRVEFPDKLINNNSNARNNRILLLASALFLDLKFFENPKGNNHNTGVGVAVAVI